MIYPFLSCIFLLYAFSSMAPFAFQRGLQTGIYVNNKSRRISLSLPTKQNQAENISKNEFYTIRRILFRAVYVLHVYCKSTK